MRVYIGNPSVTQLHGEQPRGHDPGTPTILRAGGPNAIGQMLGLLGDEWSLLIVREASKGAVHYGHFRARMPISSYMLTNRLRVLVRNGLLTRRHHPAVRSRTEYLLTPRSRSLWSVLFLMWVWERDWVTEHRDSMNEVHHVGCGRPFSPLLRCRECGAAVTDSDVSLRLGPSGAWDRSAPAAATRRRSFHDAGPYPETMSVFGNRWAAALLVAAFLGKTRFGEFQAQLGAPPGSLAERLQTFTTLGVFTGRAADNWGPQRGEYLLTEKGRALFPVLVSVLNWAQRWFHAPEGQAIILTHDACGSPFQGELACDQCNEALAGSQIRVVPNARLD